jgi:SAM-dependent methyltransferase
MARRRTATSGHGKTRGATSRATPRLYDDLASWWPILSEPAHYAGEAARHRKALVAACERRPKHVLELGSGGGNNALHLKRSFRMTLVDLSEGMLAVSRKLNPDCEHVQGDMRRVRLGRQFDAVFVHDAIGYMATEKDLAAAIRTAYAHCAPGGAAIFVPDYVRETFKPSTQHGGHDGRGKRGLRYLMWTWDPDPRDTTYLLDFAYLLRHPDGSVTSERDRHTIGLFSKATWRRLLSEAGFRVKTLLDPEPDLEPSARVVFVGKKPA